MKIDGETDSIALERAERVEALRTAHFKGGATQRKARIQCLVREAIDRATVRQAGAAKAGMDAAKAAAYHMEQNAAKLYAQCGPEALEAERATNERLTNRVLQLEEELEKARGAMVAAGICVSCYQAPAMDEDGPFSHCRCGTGEDYARRPLQRLQLLERKEKAHESPRPD